MNRSIARGITYTWSNISDGGERAHRPPPVERRGVCARSRWGAGAWNVPRLAPRRSPLARLSLSWLSWLSWLSSPVQSLFGLRLHRLGSGRHLPPRLGSARLLPRPSRAHVERRLYSLAHNALATITNMCCRVSNCVVAVLWGWVPLSVVSSM